jgi:hypothetical protein
MKNIYFRILIGIFGIFIVLIILNKLMDIEDNFIEIALTAIVIVLFGQLIFKFFKPYTFK